VRKTFRIANRSWSDSIDAWLHVVPWNAEPSMNWTFRRISIDSSDQLWNAKDSIRMNREFDSNEIDESDLHR
jgi:hypothetical protein